MQQHSGEHIVSGLVHEAFGYDNVGFHMGSDVITIDFSGMLDEEQMAEIEAKANQIIWEIRKLRFFILQRRNLKIWITEARKSFPDGFVLCASQEQIPAHAAELM